MDSVSSPVLGFFEPPQIDKQTLNKALLYVLEQSGDDLVLVTGYPMAMIKAERIVYIGTRNLYYDELRELIEMITDSKNAAMELQQQNDLDPTYVIQIERGKTLRFRVNATGCLGRNGSTGMSIVMRPMSKIPPTMAELGVPDAIQQACMPKSGLVLITGPTGSGKTTLLDSIMRGQATREDGQHILTYYAPIENDLLAIPNQTGIISQMQIGKGYGAHLREFKDGVRNSLRRHPFVIVYGEARDPETIEGAVLSAMTGHATYTTTHTSNVHMAISRMVDAFPSSDRVRLTNALIDNMRLIVHQRLLKKPCGTKRYPVRSWLVFDQEVRYELLKTPIELIPSAIYKMVLDAKQDLLSDARREYKLGNIHRDELIVLENEMGYDADMLGIDGGVDDAS